MVTRLVVVGVALVLWAASLYAQIPAGPTILILAPNACKYEASFVQEVDSLNKQLAPTAFDMRDDDTFGEGRPENMRIILRSERAFLRTLDVCKRLSFDAEQVLAYSLFKSFPNAFVRLVDTRSDGDIAALRKYAESSGVQYVLNFPSVELFRSNGQGYARVSMQLYDHSSGSVALAMSYTGNSSNPGFMYTCAEGSIYCMLGNALSQGVEAVLGIIFTNTPAMKRQRQLAGERTEVLKHYLMQNYDEKLLRAAIPVADSSVYPGIVYQVLVNDDSTRLMAFFMKKMSSVNIGTIRRVRDDGNVEVLLDSKTSGTDSISVTYTAYTVTAVWHKGTWYREDGNVRRITAATTHEAQAEYFDTLQRLHFFKEGTAVPDPGFWSAGRLAAVKMTDENLKPSDRPYIGLARIVAVGLKAEDKELMLQREEEILRTYMQPMLASAMAKDVRLHMEYELGWPGYVMIHPRDMSTIICPVKVQTGNTEAALHYYALLRQKNGSYRVYDWTRLKPENFMNDTTGPDFMKQINTLTEWNYRYDNVDDDAFWNTHVLARKGGKYLYLRKIR